MHCRKEEMYRYGIHEGRGEEKLRKGRQGQIMIVLEGQVLSTDAGAVEGLKPTKVPRVLVDGEVGS